MWTWRFEYGIKLKFKFTFMRYLLAFYMRFPSSMELKSVENNETHKNGHQKLILVTSFNVQKIHSNIMIRFLLHWFIGYSLHDRMPVLRP